MFQLPLEEYMNCARCNVPLTQHDYEGHSINTCPKCKGLWLHRHQLNELLKNGAEDLEKCSIDDNPHQDKYPSMRCLSCKDSIMKKINFLEHSDIILDYCPKCGSFWIENDELKSMHEYIERVDQGSHDVKDFSAYNIIAKISQIAYRIYH